MWAALEQSAALWGFGGSLLYALPQLNACMYDRTGAPRIPGQCVVEAIIALLVGTIAAASLTTFFTATLGLKTEGAERGMATVIGLLSNRVIPLVVERLPNVIVDILSGRVLSRLGKGDP